MMVIFLNFLSTKITVDRVGNEVPVTGAAVGPFTNTSLLGAEELARKSQENRKRYMLSVRFRLKLPFAIAGQ